MPSRRLLLLSLLAWPLAAVAAAPPLPALRAGGLTLYFRHSLTVREGQPDNDLSSCANQRNLSEDGRTAARLVGAAIADLGIPIGQVLSSPYCRCLDTARLAFGRAEVAPWLLTNGRFAESGERSRLAELARQLQTPPAAPGNRVLVAHGFNLIGLHEVLGWEEVRLAEAECVVYRAPAPEILGRVPRDGWQALAGG